MTELGMISFSFSISSLSKDPLMPSCYSDKENQVQEPNLRPCFLNYHCTLCPFTYLETLMAALEKLSDKGE